MCLSARSSIFVATVSVALAASRAGAGDVSAEFPWDPVALVAGSETAGQADLFVDHFVHRYRFTTSDHRELFLKNPERYEIQMGGGCARMGSLSGACDIGRFVVHEGRIYVFASDACRRTFLAAPDTFMERDDAPPAGDAEATRRGRERLERVVEAMGGADRIDAVRTYRTRLVRKVLHEGRDVAEVETKTIAFPGSARSDYAWGDKVWSSVLTATDGWFISPDGVRPMHGQQRAEMRRQHMGRNLLGIVKARRHPDFVAVDAGRGVFPTAAAGPEADRISVYCHGVAATLFVEPDTDRLRGISFRGRGPRAAFGQREEAYQSFAEIGGVLLPVSSSDYFDGSRVERSSEDEPELFIDAEIDAAAFHRPGAP